jgi:hypothetical protein
MALRFSNGVTLDGEQKSDTRTVIVTPASEFFRQLAPILP